MMNDVDIRCAVGLVDKKKKCVHIGSILALFADKKSSIPPDIVDIPIPLSLRGCPDQGLVYVTRMGELAWEYNGKLITWYEWKTMNIEMEPPQK